MPRRQWTFGGRLRKAETIFFLGVVLFFCWSSITAHLKITSRVVGQGSTFPGFVVPDRILDSLKNFTLGGDGYEHNTDATKSFSQVYIVDDPAAGKFAASEWNRLSKKWDSNSSYADLLKSAKTVDALPSMAPRRHPDERLIFILHSHPKMASTTLRRACWENLRSTCNVVSPKRDPKGYSNAKDLADLIRRCKDTHHFCVMGWHFGSNDFPQLISSTGQLAKVTYIHLFPFRMFREWSISAMKQVFVGHSEAGCSQLSQRLDKCDGWLELDYLKYTKKSVSDMLRISPEGQQSHPHYFVLYDYSTVDTTISELCRLYQIPMLPHLEHNLKQTRRDGSCTMETLAKFHDCFDERLLQL